MNLHEYQAKALFASYGLPVPKSLVVASVQEAIDACREIGGEQWVVKAQVHAGGRGKAGGVKVVDSPEKVADFARQWLGKRLVTYQTDSHGQPIHKILIEACTDIDSELYLGIVIDRASQRITLIASTEGGVEIEEIAHKFPEKILQVTIDPLVGPQPYQARSLAFQLALNNKQSQQFTNIFMQLAKLFEEKDLALLEVNPLVITKAGDLCCLDAKINIDNNALYRHRDLMAMRDLSQEDEREARAAQYQLNYIALKGDIGCMVNGAGLAMGTMDMIKLYGGEPANFLDVGGGATKERVSEAFKIILSDSAVKAVLVNIFGGIVRCDIIADGIIGAIKEIKMRVPVVVRLEGNNAEAGLQALAESNVNVIAAHSLIDATQQVIKAANDAGKNL